MGNVAHRDGAGCVAPRQHEVVWRFAKDWGVPDLPVPGNLWFRKLIRAANPNDVDLYFSRQLGEGKLPSPLSSNEDAVERELSRAGNKAYRRLVLDELGRAYKIGAHGSQLVDLACQTDSLVPRRDAAPMEVAVWLMVRHAEAFEFAWALYQICGRRVVVSEYAWPMPDVNALQAKQKPFERAVKHWFANTDRGRVCRVKLYAEGDGAVLTCVRADHVTVMAHWVGAAVKLDTLRPAAEDVLWFSDHGTSLCIRAQTRTIREFYFRTLCEQLHGGEDLLSAVASGPMYCLSSIEAGEFTGGPNGRVREAAVVGLSLADVGTHRGKQELRSDNALADYLRLRALGATGDAVCTEAAIRFVIDCGDRTGQDTVLIRPPRESDVHTSPYSRDIINYLRWAGIRLS